MATSNGTSFTRKKKKKKEKKSTRQTGGGFHPHNLNHSSFTFKIETLNLVTNSKTFHSSQKIHTSIFTYICMYKPVPSRESIEVSI